MFLGGIPKASAQQIADLLAAQDRSRGVFVACSGSYRIERTIWQRWPGTPIYSNDVTFFSCMLGRWLSGDDLDYRFTGELAPLGDLVEGASSRRRMAAVSVALDISDHASGKRNRFKQGHVDHMMARLPELVDLTEVKLAKAFGELQLAGFHAGDLREQIEKAIEAKAAIVTFPPFYKGGYETLYKWLDANTEWSPPSYPMFEPRDLERIFERIDASESPYVVGAGRLLDVPDHKPKALFVPPTKTPHYLYARDGDPKLLRNNAPLKPFVFQPLDLSRITADSKVQVKAVDGARAMYVRIQYLKKSIVPAPGRWNYLVYVDDMLAGVLTYDLSKFGPREDSLYLLSDVSVSREARVSKLIARIATGAGLAQHMAAKALKPVSYVVTTAFSDHPVSMKYRGLFELLSRKDGEKGGFQLQYGSELRAETPQEAFDWWWSTHASQDSGVRRTPGRQAGRNGRGRGGR